MDKREAQEERARLQNLLDSYEADRLSYKAKDERRGIERKLTPDRAGNVRARIARLDQVIGESD
jgi:hypothetical protein